MRAETITAEFTIAIDHRERLPFAFTGIHADARQGRRLIEVGTQVKHLRSGDYSILGMEDQISIERKSLVDTYGTLGQARLRFQRELYRLSQLQWAAVVVEADWTAILTQPPERSRLLPKTIFRSVIAWQMRYPNVHWWLCPGREFAEATTYRLLERWYRDTQTKRKEDMTNGTAQMEASATACG
jgi:ERCC4-type nuclease